MSKDEQLRVIFGNHEKSLISPTNVFRRGAHRMHDVYTVVAILCKLYKNELSSTLLGSVRCPSIEHTRTTFQTY